MANWADDYPLSYLLVVGGALCLCTTLTIGFVAVAGWLATLHHSHGPAPVMAITGVTGAISVAVALALRRYAEL